MTNSRKIITGLAAVMFSISLSARNINGVIYNTDGHPLKGVQVIARGTNNTCISNNKGEFTIEVPDSVLSIVCDLPGMQKASTDIGNSDYLDIYMAPLFSDSFYDLSIEDMISATTCKN